MLDYACVVIKTRVFSTHRLLFWIKSLFERLGLFVQSVSRSRQISQGLWKQPKHKLLKHFRVFINRITTRNNNEYMLTSAV